MKNIVVFASGSGTNANNICAYFASHLDIKVAALFCNNPQAGVIEKMAKWNVPVELFTKNEFLTENVFLDTLNKYQPDCIVLAGFLWLVPSYLVHAFENRIINIHPALLPQYGGKGMYGKHVHEAVLAHNEKQHGITIHLVNEEFDKGQHLFQQSFVVEPKDNLETIAAKIAALEMANFPKEIEQYVLKLDN